ncbi:MAG: helix-turn-helix domain-containing protein [Dysgonamonadaceae bacterium]|jgi:AraC-like DNA-binding protein|nr:helix-turn-helix domain-containing protein [Dysgonamonadaceae bacterium]
MYCDEICNVEQHLACPDYQSADNPLVELLTFGEGEKIRRVKPYSQLVFVVRGELEFSYASNSGLKAVENDFFIIPQKIGFNICFQRPASLLIFTLKLDIVFCQQLRRDILNLDDYAVRRKPIVLSANKLLLDLMELAAAAVGKCFLCTIFFRSQIAGLITSISAFYPREEALQFFSPLVSHSLRDIDDDIFKSTVLQAQNSIFSVRELADLANQNVVTFRRRFERIFNMQPHAWITQNRKRLIYEELTMNTKTLAEIVYMFNFSRTNELARFCQIHFGQTAKSIRDNKNR